MTNLPPAHPSVLQRNFMPFAVASQPGVRYLRHASGVLVLALGADHELMSRDGGKGIAEIVWNPAESGGSGKKQHQRKGGVDRSKLELSGKGKKVGQKTFFGIF